MNYKDLYQDIWGSTGGKDFNFGLFFQMYKKMGPVRMKSFLHTQVVNGRVLNAFKRQKHSDMFLPKSIVIEPTFNCNLKCTDCYAPDESSNKVMSQDDFSSIIEQAAKLGCYRFVLMGGEPTLKSVMDQVLPVIKKYKNCFFTFCTNCTQIDEPFVERVKKLHNVAFLLSSEGTREETEKRRGPGVYDKYLNALKLLKKARISFAVSITLDPSSWKEQISEEVIKDYVDNGGTIVYTYVIFSKDKMSHQEVPRVEYLTKLQEYVNKYPIFLADGRFGKLSSGGIVPRDLTQVCIDPDGNVRPSRFFYDTTYGNIKESSLKEILGKPELIEHKKSSRLKSGALLTEQDKELAKMGFKVAFYDWA